MTAHEAEGSVHAPRVDIFTPSYRPDLELCADLNRSVLVRLPSQTRHHVIVPRRDLPAFQQLAGPRTEIHDAADFLPSHIKKIPRLNAWLDLRRPWPPVRGWVAQQLLKLEAAARSDADVALMVDSDIVFVRPVDASSFLDGGSPVLYRRPGGVHAGMPRHLAWHCAARTLLGLPAPVTPPLPDYICWPGVWEPRLVRSMLARIEEVAGARWQTAVGSHLHFSEMILYGVYVDEVLPEEGRPTITDDMRCVSHSDERALTGPEMQSMLHALRPDDVAVMISAKSGTDLRTRREVLARSGL